MNCSGTDSDDDPYLTVAMAEIDRFGTRVGCPVCENPIAAAVGTPSVPSRILRDRAIRAAVGDDVPVYGWRCRRHRSHDVRALAPATVAPESYESAGAVVAGQVVDVAIPGPVVRRGESQ